MIPATTTVPKFCEVKVKNEYHKDCIKVTPLEPQKVEVKRERMKRQRPQPQQEKSAWEGKETILYCSNGIMKLMLVPSKEPNYYPITIKEDELNRLKAKAVVLSEKERLKIVEDAKEEQSRLERESDMRKKELQQYDSAELMKKDSKLSELEREAKDKANYLLKRAWELRRDEEEEVKNVNSVILQVKCQAIRDAQLAEHKLIQKELKEEERRLELMVEDMRIRKMIDEKQRMESDREKKARYCKELNQQVEEIQARRLLEAEYLLEERKRANEAMFVVMLEEMEEARKFNEDKKKLREELNMANEQMRRAQDLQREEDRLADLKIQEFLKMKAEREERFEREKQAEKTRKELEYARQRGIQEKAAGLQTTQEEMAAIRRQEEYEREWRRKEKEAARKKLQLEEDCRLARDQQIMEQRRYQAMELAKEKVEYERNLKVQLELQERERLIELKRKYDAEKYRETILQQINAKEKEKIEEKREKFLEGIGLKAEQAKRRADMLQVLQKKVEQLRQNNVPDMYIADVQRRFGLV